MYSLLMFVSGFCTEFYHSVYDSLKCVTYMIKNLYLIDGKIKRETNYLIDVVTLE